MIRNSAHLLCSCLHVLVKMAYWVLLTLGPGSPGFPGGQIQGAGVEPTSLGPFRH